MLLQPVVENAIKHGIAPYKIGGTVSVKTDDRKRATARHDITTVVEASIKTKPKVGLGLELVRGSVELLYGPESRAGKQRLSLVSSVPGRGHNGHTASAWQKMSDWAMYESIRCEC